MKLSRREALKLIAAFSAGLALPSCSITSKRSLPLLQPPNIPIPGKNMTVAMLGATGMAGSYILSEALVQGYDIRALARTPAKLEAVKDRIVIVKGDARDRSAIQELLLGSDVVISALGPVKADGRAALDICTIATGHIIPVMQELHIARYILLSGAAVTMPGDNRNLKGWLIQNLARLALSYAVHDKVSEYQLLKDSDVDWTLVRCPLIDAELFRHEAVATLDTPVSFHLRAGELARFVIGQIDSKEYIRKGPFLGSR